MVDAKKRLRTVLFDSKNETAQICDAVDTQAFDAADVSSRIVAAGLVPMARIHAFRTISSHAQSAKCG
jgi:hypothetical protein